MLTSRWPELSCGRTELQRGPGNGVSTNERDVALLADGNAVFASTYFPLGRTNTQKTWLLFSLGSEV